MNRKLGRLLLPLLVVALFVGFSRPVRAASSAQGRGTLISITTNFTPVGLSGGNLLFQATWAGYMTGTLEAGSLEASACSGAESGVVHADNSANVTGTATCTGAANGQAGTFSFDYVTKIAPGGSTVTGSFVVYGSGTLANLSGHASYQGIAPSIGVVSLNYTAQLQFN